MNEKFKQKMTKNINDMINKKCLNLTFLQKMNFYGGVFLILFIFSLNAYSLFEIHITHTYQGLRTSKELINVSLLFFSIAVIYFFIKKRRLRFFEIKLNYNADNFEKALQKTSEELKWTIIENNENYIHAIRTSNWSGSWGERITIIKLENSILINSICDPKKIGSDASYGWNKKNKKIFMKNIMKEVAENNPAII